MKREEDEKGQSHVHTHRLSNMETHDHGQGQSVSWKQKGILAAILKEYSDVFPPDLPVGIPPQREVDHRINLLPGSTPPSRPAYRTSPADSAELKKQLDSLIEHGFVIPSTSPYGAPVLFVKKKDGSIRMCVDFRALNKITERNMSGLPRMDELFDRILGAKIFSKLDLRSGYHQIRLHPDDTAKTAFNTRFGHFEFTVLPFGLTNAPATFSTLMQKLFHPYLDEFVVVFLDDVLIYSKNEEEHAVHLRKALDVLRREKLYGKLEKCEFFEKSVHFLGHVISGDGLAVEADKVKAIRDWPTPSGVDDVRSFLGLAGFYRRFIEHFSLKALPLTNLTQKSSRFRWGDDEQAAFEAIKQAASHAPVLLTPDPSLPYTISTDASGYAVGAVLRQDRGNINGLQPVAYMSKKMLDAEKNYAVGEQEQLAIVLALKEWRHYIHGVKCTILTDNRALQYLDTTTDLSKRQIRWAEVLAQYDLKIIYRPGKENLVADALSRRPDHRSKYDSVKQQREKDEQLRVWQVKAAKESGTGAATAVTAASAETVHVLSSISQSPAVLASINTAAPLATSTVSVTEIQDKIKSVMKETVVDAERREILTILSEQKDSAAAKDWMKKGWSSRDGLLYRFNRLFVPDDRSLRSEVLNEAHDVRTSGHFGTAKTIAVLNRDYYWPGLAKEVKEYIKSCLTCATTKSSNQRPAGLLQPLPIPSRRWEQVTFDLITALPKTKRKHTAIAVWVDKLSKMVHLAPCTTEVTAVDLADLFYREIVRYHGVLVSIVSDRDPRFTANFWQALWALLGTKLKMSTAYHPQSDGQTENTNKTLENMLRAYVNNSLSDWDDYLVSAEIAINN